MRILEYFFPLEEMTHIEVLKAQPSEILAACGWRDCVVVARRNGSIEVLREGRIFASLEIHYFAIALTSKGDSVVSLDVRGVLRQHVITADSIETQFEWQTEKIKDFSNMPGLSVVDRSSELVVTESKILWRAQLTIADMSLDRHEKRWVSPVVSVDRLSGGEDWGTVSSEGEIVGMADCEGRLAILENFESRFQVRILGAAHPLLLNVHRASKSELGNHLVGLACGAGTIFLIDQFGVLAYRGESLSGFFLDNSPPNRNMSRINPLLNLFRKHSAVHPAQSVLDAVAGLSLAESWAVEGDEGKLGQNALVAGKRVGWKNWCLTDEGICLSSREGGEIVLAGFDGELKRKWHPHDGLVGKVGPVWVFQHGISNQSSSVHPGVLALALTSENLLVALTRSDLRFHHGNSASVVPVSHSTHHSRHESGPPRERRDEKIFPLKDHPLTFLVSSWSDSQVVRVVQNSPVYSASSIVSDEKGEVFKKLSSMVDVTDQFPSIASGLPTTGFVQLAKGDCVQISQAKLLLNARVVFECVGGEIFVGHAARFTNEVLALQSDGLLVSLVDGAIVTRQLPGLGNPTCISVSSLGLAVGTFDGSVSVYEPRTGGLLVSIEEFGDCGSIESVVLHEDTLLVGTRTGILFVYDLSRTELVLSQKIGVLKLQISPVAEASSSFLLLTDRLHVLDHHHHCWSVQLGDQRVRSFASTNETISVLTGDLIFCFNFSLDDHRISTFSTPLPFQVDAGVFAQEEQQYMYLLGWLEKQDQKALITVVVDSKKIGAIDDPDSVRILSILPFNSAKEEPVCLTVWNPQEMFPSNGLVVVGTRGFKGGKGRLILFERDSMAAVSKTSIPSAEISSLCPLSESTLAVGCTDTIVLVGLRPGPRSTPAVLHTICTFTTYTIVKHITAVSETELLIVTDNGTVSLLCFQQETLAVQATLESQKRIVSKCVMLPHSRRFFCSDSEGEILMYTVDQNEVGLMPQLARVESQGTTIAAFASQDTRLVLGMSNGSLLQPGHDERMGKHTRAVSSST